MKIAIAIPTYNSIEKLRVLLENNYRLFIDRDCDFYIYDSSDTDATREYIANNAYEKLVYRRYDPEVTSNEKVYEIYEQLSCEYDYIWMNRDATWFEEELIDKVLEVINGDRPNILYISPSDGYYDKKFFSDAKNYSLCTNVGLAFYGATIINSNMLYGVNWSYYKKKYLYSNSAYFSHVGFFVEQMARLDELKGIILEYPSTKRHLIKNRSLWYPETVKVWGCSWVSLCDELGQVFRDDSDYVERMINSADNRFLEEQLIIYRALEWFDYEKYETYREYLSRVSDVCIERMKEISLMSKDEAYSICVGKIKAVIKDSTKDYKHIIIYGAGFRGKHIGKIFDAVNVGFDAYMVTNRTEKIASDGHKIVRLGDYELGDDTGIVLGVGKENKTDVLNLLEKRNYLSRICYGMEQIDFRYAFLFEDDTK